METYDDGSKRVIEREDKCEPCKAWNKWTGACNHYDKRKAICVHWKCDWLNFLSRIFGEPLWNGTWDYDYHPPDEISGEDD